MEYELKGVINDISCDGIRLHKMGRSNEYRTAEKLSFVSVSLSYLVDPASGICLSQRLSHASVSMSELYNETANGSVKQL